MLQLISSTYAPTDTKCFVLKLICIKLFSDIPNVLNALEYVNAAPALCYVFL